MLVIVLSLDRLSMLLDLHASISHFFKLLDLPTANFPEFEATTGLSEVLAQDVAEIQCYQQGSNHYDRPSCYVLAARVDHKVCLAQ